MNNCMFLKKNGTERAILQGSQPHDQRRHRDVMCCQPTGDGRQRSLQKATPAVSQDTHNLLTNGIC